jgi:hypothetical protein
MKKLNGDVVEWHARFVAGDVCEAAAGIVHLAVCQHETDFGFVLDGVDDVGGTEGHVYVGHIVLMEKSGFVSGDVYAENADVGIFKDEMVVWLLGDGNRRGGLSVHGKCKKHQR